jgi:hypothetical protein
VKIKKKFFYQFSSSSEGKNKKVEFLAAFVRLVHPVKVKKKNFLPAFINLSQSVKISILPAFGLLRW